MSRFILCEDIGRPTARCIPGSWGQTAACDPECGRHAHPEGYVNHALWAEEMLVDHRQRQCPGCGLWTIWEPRCAADDLGRAVAT